MSDYKRLKDNLNILSLHNDKCYYKSVLQLTGYMKTERELIKEIISDTQELLDKIENGTLIELPYKVGDKFYLPWEYDGEHAVAKLTVERVLVDDKQIETNLESDDYGFMKKYKCGVYGFEDIGKIIFLTAAEAEAKLKELKREV